MTPAPTQSELFSESHWLKIGPHPTKDIFLTPPPLPQWIFYVALSMSISWSQYRTVVTSHCNQAIARCLDQAIVIIYASLWPPLSRSGPGVGYQWHLWPMVVTPGPAQLGSVPYLDLITKFDSPGHRADTCDSFQSSDWLESGPRALSLAGLFSFLLRAGYRLVKRILYIDWIWSRELQEDFVRVGCSEN